MRSKIFFTIAVTAVALSAVPPLPAHAEPSEVKIGMMLPLTGNEANESKVLANAVNLAVKQVNAAGGIKGQTIRLIMEDTKSSPENTLIAYENLLKSQVSAVIGPFKSALIVAMIPKMMSIGVPTVIGGTNPRLTDEHRYMMRFRPDDNVSAYALLKFIKEDLKFSKIGVLHDNGAFGKGGANLIDKNSSQMGLAASKREGFNFGERDLSRQVKSIKDSGAQAMVVYAANYGESAEAEKEWAKTGKTMAYIGSPSSMSTVTLAEAGAAAEGAHAVVDFVFGQTPENKKYADEYRAEYHQEPDSISAYTYDGIKVLAKAMNAVGTDKEKVRDYIFKLRGYHGVVGTYDFDERGDGLHSMTIAKIENGKPKAIRTIAAGK